MLTNRLQIKLKKLELRPLLNLISDDINAEQRGSFWFSTDGYRLWDWSRQCYQQRHDK